MEILERKDVMPVSYLKKSPYTGSRKAMRYRMEREEAGLRVTVWRGPLACLHVPEEEKISEVFSLDEAGIQAAVVWLNRIYEEREEFWKDTRILR